MSVDPSAAPVAGRRVHWLELFFDLVMVAYIGQIAHTMHGDPGWPQAVAFFALLAAAWWAWVNATMTMNLFGARVTPSIWIAVTVAMIAIGIMAAAVPDALGERAAAFAIGNALIRIIWALPWLLNSAAARTPWWRPVLYSFVPAVLWLVSIAVPQPWQFVLWGVAVAIEIALLSFLSAQETWLRDNLDLDHLVERVGLLVVIVFGESILQIIADLDAHWGIVPGVTAVLGLLAVSMLVWIFFGYASPAVERGLRGLLARGRVGAVRDSVMYLPFLLVSGIVLFAAGLGTAVAESGHALPIGAAVCLAAGISLFFVSSAAEALRYGVRWPDIVMWGPPGILLPWLLVPAAALVPAEGVVGTAVILIAILLVLNHANATRMRARRTTDDDIAAPVG